MKKVDIEIDADSAGTRIDKIITDEVTDLSRSYIQKLISENSVLVNNAPVKANYKAREEDCIEVIIPDAVELQVEPENIPLDIIYEDSDIIVVNKPKGMVVHPAAGHYSGTLVNALMYHCHDNLSGINGVLRPGIVHRIDKDTTGVLVVCKNDNAHNCIAQQLREHSINRVYQAICYGNFSETDGTVDAPIGRSTADRKKRAIDYKNGKNAVTHYHVIENLKGFAHIECRLETGRTHQIRVHMSSIHHPLLGDNMYCSAKSPYPLEGQTLHAGVLGFIHPTTGEYMEFTAPLPDYFTDLLKKLRY